jgi:hypothetical protein
MYRLGEIEQARENDGTDDDGAQCVISLVIARIKSAVMTACKMTTGHKRSPLASPDEGDAGHADDDTAQFDAKQRMPDQRRDKQQPHASGCLGDCSENKQSFHHVDAPSRAVRPRTCTTRGMG